MNILIINTSVSMVVMIAMMIIGILTKLILARVLTINDIGIFFIGQTFLGMFTYLVSLNLGEAIARYISSNENQSIDILTKAFGIIFKTYSISTIIIIILFLSYQYYFRKDLINNDLTFVFTIFILIAPLKILANFIGSAYQGVGRLHIKLIYSDLLPSLIFIISIIILKSFFNLSLISISIIYAIPYVLVPYLYMGKFKLRYSFFYKQINHSKIPNLLKFSLPLLIAGLLSWPLNSVPIIMGILTSPEDVSYYCLALSIVSCIYLSVSAVDMAGLSQWTKLINRKDKHEILNQYRCATRWSILFGSILFFACLICPKELTYILLGVKFMQIVEILPALAFIVFINVLSGPSESLLKAYEDTRYIFVTRLSVALTTLIPIYPALKYWGLNGAVIVFGLSTLCSVFMYSLRLYSRFNLLPFDKFYFRTICSIVCAISIVDVFNKNIKYDDLTINLLIKLFIYIFFLFIFIYLFKVTPNEEKNIIKRSFFKLSFLKVANK